jgi:ATP synthase protein I
MPSDNKDEPRDSTQAAPAKLKRVGNLTTESALALELPFTFVGAVAVGGFLGYYLDKWLHTSPWLLVTFGGLGFVAGISEISRRLRPPGRRDGGNDGSSS